jgi:hypothetical protein
LITPEEQIIFVNEVEGVLCESVHLCAKYLKENMDEKIEKKGLFLVGLRVF